MTAATSGSFWSGGNLHRLRRPASSPDTTAVRFAAAVRLALVVAAAAAGSFIPDTTGRRADLMLVVGLAGVPWATVLLFASERTGNRVALMGGPLGDLALLASVAVVYPAANQAVLLGYLVVIVFAVYTMGRPLAAGVGAGAIALAWLCQLLVPGRQRAADGVLIAFTAAVVAMVSLFERTAVLRTRADTRYQRLQTKAATIVAHVADAIVVTDAAGVITQANPAAERVLGNDSAPLVGSPCAMSLALRKGEKPLDCTGRCGLLDVVSPEAAASGVEVWRLCRDVRQPLLASAAPVEAAGGAGEVVHSMRDITQLKQAEEAKTLFLATATHELKTPLTVINGFAETLRTYEDLDPDLKMAALDAIRSRGMELSRIIDRLLLSSRIEAGRVHLRLEPVDVARLAGERAATFGQASGRAVSARIPEGVPAVTANAEAFVTVVDHLLDNAVKYSPHGSPLELDVQAMDDRLVTVAVTDHGIGMDPEHAARCFEKFWQAEATDVRRFGGTGIGLYIVQSLVEAMGGTVDVRTARGHGSTFIVSLPVRPAGDEPAPADAGEGDAADRGEPTSIREFMRQIGVPERRGR
ncbi:MAG TPA: PAS domain-containing sensor histidine kinase [Acidimicrobiales bacterium]|nr:PAS domain-containing sensor histidine kinase [Acidimicrobiales bacterium]